MRRVAWALVVVLAGCGAFEGPQPSETQHTLCYTRMASNPDQLHTLAKEACGTAEPHFQKQEMDLTGCPLLVPERVYFSCGAS
ncbi:MAG TPA: hypothetical protein VN802_08845 [Stellaceae bacterium]|nr:hypothetical protein [Stellaceae bacterium]